MDRAGEQGVRGQGRGRGVAWIGLVNRGCVDRVGEEGCVNRVGNEGSVDRAGEQGGAWTG